MEVKNLRKAFGGLLALDDLDLRIEKNTIVGLIGPNGAGKTTLINILSGIYRPNSGEVFFRGNNVTGWKPHKLVEIGIGRTFQTTRLFNEKTVLENILMAQHLVTYPGARKAYTGKVRKKDGESAEGILRFVGLYAYRHDLAKNIPFAQQRRLAIGLALATEPELLLLDEPVAGMNPLEAQKMMELIQGIREQGTAILMIEHNMQVVMSLCHWIMVLNYGRKIAEGTPEEISGSEVVIQAYLGEEHDS